MASATALAAMMLAVRTAMGFSLSCKARQLFVYTQGSGRMTNLEGRIARIALDAQRRRHRRRVSREKTFGTLQYEEEDSAKVQKESLEV
jgi:hypothetical protein